MGIKLGSITELATGLLGSHKIPYTTGAITRLLRLDTLADWVVQTASAFVPSGTGAIAESVQTALRRWKWLDQAGAVGNGITDDSTAIQTAINEMSAAGGGYLLGSPGKDYRCNVTLKAGVVIVGDWFLSGDLASYSSATAVRFTAAAAGIVIDTPVADTGLCGVIGISIQGLGAGTACKGIRFRDVSRGVIKAVNVNNFADEGILVDSGSIACTFDEILAVNCVLNRTRAAKIGAVDIDGTDHFVSRVESTISGSIQGTVQSVNLYCIGVLVRGSVMMLDNVIGEISDIGVEVQGDYSVFKGCRADLNYGHGWNVTGSGNTFDACFGLSNSQDTTNTYDNFLVSGVNNMFMTPRSHFATAKVPRYAINDQAPQSDSNKNYYIAPQITGIYGTRKLHTAASQSAAWVTVVGSPRALTVNSTTPAIDTSSNAPYGYFTQTNTNPTTITDFTGGVNGQEFTYLCADNNTTIQHNGATIVTPNAGDVKLRSGVHYNFIKEGLWRFADDQVLFATHNVTADVGNAAKSLQWRIDPPTQIWATAITADRAVTLSTTGAIAGAKFRIVRAATATGAFNLNVGTGPLKALGIGSFCDVEYNGSAWVLTAYGVL